MSEWLPSVLIAVDAAIAVLIWLVQLIIYPSFFYVEQAGFIEWHGKYAQRISYIVIPLMFAQAGGVIFELIQHPGCWDLVAAIAVVTAWLATFTLSVPCHRRLQKIGKDEPTIARLVMTNWIRTASWNVALAAGIAGHLT